ncbi:MAG: hypothetical protein M0010_19015 [Actinomycetota bacterium]|nr:hypothetical protein [Actinomycetota bacterium]
MQTPSLLGVVGEPGDMLATRTRAGSACSKKNLTSFVHECVATITAEEHKRVQPLAGWAASSPSPHRCSLQKSHPRRIWFE